MRSQGRATKILPAYGRGVYGLRTTQGPGGVLRCALVPRRRSWAQRGGLLRRLRPAAPASAKPARARARTQAAMPMVLVLIHTVRGRHNGNILQSACQGHAELTRWHGATRRALHPMMQACVAASRLALPQGGTRSEPLSEVERGCRLGSGSLAGPWLRGSSAVRARARATLTALGARRRATFRD